MPAKRIAQQAARRSEQTERAQQQQRAAQQQERKMVKVAPQPGGHRKAPALPAGKSGGGKGAGGGGGNVDGSKMMRQTEELQHLLRLRAEELVARDNDLAACGEQIVKLETHATELQEENGRLVRNLQDLTRQLEGVQAQYTDLSSKHASLRTQFQLQHAETEELRAVIAATPGLKPTPPAARAAIKGASEAGFEERSAGGGRGSPTRGEFASWPGHSSEERAQWSSHQWLSTTRVLELVGNALLAPIAEKPRDERPKDLAFVRAFAGQDGAEGLMELLAKDKLKLLYELRDELHKAIQKLADRNPPMANEVCGKYVDVLDSAGGGKAGGGGAGDEGGNGSALLIDGGVRTFNERIEELLGPPHSRVLETMLQEHCEASDSSAPFTAPSYKITTTSKIEWWFVVDPAEALKKHVSVRAEIGEDMPGRLSPLGWPAEAGVLSSEKMRGPRTLQSILQEMRALGVGAALSAAGVAPLVDAEVIAGRLYTGPLYVKYTAVLRGLFHHHREAKAAAKRNKAAGVSGGSGKAGGKADAVAALAMPKSSSFGGMSSAAASEAAEKLKGEEFVAYFQTLCRGNTYATTIHALNSALIKLAKLGTTNAVYRGVSADVLPEWLWEAAQSQMRRTTMASDGGGDGVDGVVHYSSRKPELTRGGIEFGFLSATADAELAMKYAADLPSSGEASGGGGVSRGAQHRVVLELQTNMLSRAADLSWLSQYPHEREAAFPALTGHELIGTRVDGTCVVVELRLSTKPGAQTLHEQVTKMRRSHLQLIDHFLEDMRVCEIPEKALGRLKALQGTHKRYEQGHFNNPDKYVSSTEAAVAAQRMAISKLAHPSTWDEVAGSNAEKARKMEKAAQYCRRVGRGDVASALHRLAGLMNAGKGGWKPWRPGGHNPAAPDLKHLA